MKNNFYLQPIRRFRLSEFRLRIEKMSAEMFVVSSTSTARFVKRRLVLVEEHRARARFSFTLYFYYTYIPSSGRTYDGRKKYAISRFPGIYSRTQPRR